MIVTLIWVAAIMMYGLVMGGCAAALPRALKRATDWDEDVSDMIGVISSLFWPVGLPAVMGIVLGYRASPEVRMSHRQDKDLDAAQRDLRIAQLRTEVDQHALTQDKINAERIELTKKELDP